jgi:hypothetical protein
MAALLEDVAAAVVEAEAVFDCVFVFVTVCDWVPDMDSVLVTVVDRLPLWVLVDVAVSDDVAVVELVAELVIVGVSEDVVVVELEAVIDEVVAAVDDGVPVPVFEVVRVVESVTVSLGERERV